ncbi:plasmolipin isoform X2 [Parambassis ranga]|uniref:Plasmolipin n=1 Tax=Parambassis ranga TaxID=210632 RepID=A0A6P7IU03_9TELE|nr:plasmolipin isoform X2 [Parambassis ranga]
MADFPSKVTTETSSPQTQSSQQGGNSLQGLAADVAATMNMSFLRSIKAILMIVEILLGLLHWALIASTPYTVAPAYGWVLFVAITLWLLTTILFFMHLCDTLSKVPAVPWPLTVMAYNGIATILYVTAFLANAVSVHSYFWYYGHLAAAAVRCLTPLTLTYKGLVKYARNCVS